jgi:hydroxyacylglutathione hydrolase
MILEQYHLGSLSLSSYLVGDETTGQAVVVDPQRDVGRYLADAARRHVAIVGVIDTHFHADFVAGHLELAAATGAWIGLGARAEAEYPFRPLHHGDRIPLGEVELEILETPGHTWESITVLVREHAAGTEPCAALTGDTLFIGDVGRPDLSATLGADPDELARALYRSVHEDLMTLPDAVRLLPAHSAGSACGKNLSPELESTIGAQRGMNPSVAPMPEDEFVELITTGQPSAPAYFAVDAKLNRSLHPVMPQEPAPAPLDAAALHAALAAGARIVDARPPAVFAESHLAGAINVGADGRFEETAGMIFGCGDRMVIVAEPGQEAEVQVRLGRIGIDDVVGYVRGLDALRGRQPGLFRRAERITAADVDAAAADPGTVVLDVRNRGERERGLIPGSLHIPLAELPRRHPELPAERRVVVHCASGWRSSVAASVLRSLGYREVADVVGGYTAWAQLHKPVPA